VVLLERVARYERSPSVRELLARLARGEQAVDQRVGAEQGYQDGQAELGPGEE
jgi:hypothetical protein